MKGNRIRVFSAAQAVETIAQQFAISYDTHEGS
jgi:hypothetical protein